MGSEEAPQCLSILEKPVQEFLFAELDSAYKMVRMTMTKAAWYSATPSYFCIWYF